MRSDLARRAGGFTLIEIMVVIVILGVLAAIAVPRIMSKPDEARVKAAQTEIAQLLQALVQIVAEIAEARNITLVLNRQQVVIAPNEMDITQEAMAQLDAKLPSVDLTQ